MGAPLSCLHFLRHGYYSGSREAGSRAYIAPILEAMNTFEMSETCVTRAAVVLPQPRTYGESVYAFAPPA
jgi:hypothetical protein